MKKLIALYHQSLVLKLIVFLLSSLFIIFLFSDYVIDAFVQNTVLWYKIQLYRWIIIPILLTVVVFLILRRPFKQYKKSIEDYTYIQKNYRFVIDNLIDDYFFYRHEPGKPFVYISSSVTNVLGFTKTDFIINYQKYGAGELYDGIFEKHKSYIEHQIKPPVNEIVISDSKQRKCYLEIKEIPILNENQEIIAIEGTAKNITKYKTIETELNEKEKKYQTIFEAISDGMLVIKDNKFIDCNSRILEIFDCTAEEIIMHTPFHYRFSPSVQPNGIPSRELAMQKIALAYQGIPQHFEWVHLRNGKDPFPAEISLTKFTFDNEDYILAIVRDVSQKKNIIETLKIKEESYQLLYNNLPIGALQLNEDFKILSVNPVGKKILQIEQEHEATFFANLLKQLIEKSEEDRFYQVSELLLPNEMTILLSIHINKYLSDETNFYIVLFEDITETQQLRQTCNQKENYFREILENSRQILYKLNVETGNYEYISSALYDILGYTPDEFYAMSADEIKSLLHPEDLQKADTIVAKLIHNLDSFENEFVVEYRIRHKNGEYKWLNDKYQFISDEHHTYIIGNIIDITQLKEAEERLRKYIMQNNEK